MTEYFIDDFIGILTDECVQETMNGNACSVYTCKYCYEKSDYSKEDIIHDTECNLNKIIKHIDDFNPDQFKD